MDKSIQETLDGFPSCFKTFHFVEKLGKDRKSKILDKLVAERNASGFDDGLEDITALNLISFMSFAVGKFEDAIKYNNAVLENNYQNINALVIKARYHLHKSEFAKSIEQCSLLETLKTNELLMLYAKAEHAYTCSRLGMEMCNIAEKMFSEAILESAGKEVPVYDICMWKFGLALTMRKQLNFVNRHDENIEYFRLETQKCIKAFELFLDIINQDGVGLDRHKARSYVQMGDLLQEPCMANQKTIQIQGYLQGKDIKFAVNDCYERGYALGNDDVFVLEKCAKYCRRCGQLEQSIDLCRRAIRIRETSIGHHYLALGLKNKLEGVCTDNDTTKGLNKPQFVRNLMSEMDTCITQTEQGQIVQSLTRLDSGLYSMEEQVSSPEICHELKRDGFADDFKYKRTAAPQMTGEASEYVLTKEMPGLKVVEEVEATDRVPFSKRDFQTKGYKTDLYTNDQFCQNENEEWQAATRKRKGPKKTQSYSKSVTGSHYGSEHERSFNEYIPTSRRGYGASYKTQSNTSDQGNRKQHERRNVTRGTSNELSRSSSREHTVSVEELRRKIIKSPKKPIPLPKDQIGEIIHHLDKSYELSENMAALYDKGLVLRAAGLLDEALDVFKSMFRNKSCSLVVLANAYEQSALCLQDRSMVVWPNRREYKSVPVDVKEYLLKAIEIQWNLIAKQPTLQNCWISFPTLKGLLEENRNSKSNRKELGILYRRVNDYRGAIGWFKQVLDMETEDCGKASVHMDIVENCLKIGEYGDAILHLDMVQGLPQSGIAIDEKLYFEAHIEGALRSFLAREEEMCRLRLKNALDFNRVAKKQSCVGNNGQVPEHEERFDVFILYDLKLETIGRNIWRLLNSLGLETTVNDDCAAPNLLRLVGLSDVIEKSTHTVLILGNDMDNLRHIQRNTECVKCVQDDRRYGNLIVVKENASVKVGAVFRGFQALTYKEGVESLTPNNKQWIKELLWMIASGRKFEPF